MNPLPSLLIRAGLTALPVLLGACGGGSGGTPSAPSSNIPSASAPQAPVLTLTPTAAKTFRFTWTDVAGETGYRLLEDPDGTSGYVRVATLAADTTQHELAILLPTRVHARYILQACRGDACTDSAPISVPDSLAQAVDFLKASNTGAYDLFGSSIALTADGMTLAIGAPEERSAASGVDGDQSNDDRPGSGAVYVFTREAGAWRQQAYLKAAHPDQNDAFGYALALSTDGMTLAVGAPHEDSASTGVDGNASDNGSQQSGAVYVFARNGQDWHQQAYLKASNTDRSDQFGHSIALSGNGDALAIGAVGESSAATGVNGNQDDNSAPGAGAVYVFARSGGSWQQRAYVKASNTEFGDNFGACVALSAEGHTLAVGAPTENSAASGVNGDERNGGSSSSGAVYVFSFSAGAWHQQAYVKASNTGVNDSFGRRIALSGDGDTLAVGAAGESSAATGVDGNQQDDSLRGSGAVYVFTRSGGAWEQQAYLKASNTNRDDAFGTELSLSANGDALAVGAPHEDGADADVSGSGAVYVFARSGGIWRQRSYLKAPTIGTYDRFGSNIALSASGHTLAVAAPEEDSAATGINGNQADDSAMQSGAAYLF